MPPNTSLNGACLTRIGCGSVALATLGVNSSRWRRRRSRCRRIWRSPTGTRWRSVRTVQSTRDLAGGAVVTTQVAIGVWLLGGRGDPVCVCARDAALAFVVLIRVDHV